MQTLILHWDGSSWSIVSSPNGSSENNVLSAVTAVSANDVWTVGVYDESNDNPYFRGHTLIEHWDGSSWSIVSSPNTAGYNLTGITAVSATDIWAVGSTGNIVPLTLTMHYDGTNWSVVSSPNVCTTNVCVNSLSGVSAVSSNDVWAVGTYHTWYTGDYTSMTMHWDGSNWTMISSPNVPNGQTYLNGVTAISSNDIWAVGSSYDNTNGSQTLTMHYDGSSWSIVSSPSLTSSFLSGVAAVNTNDVWAVGGSSSGTFTEHYVPGSTPPPPVTLSLQKTTASTVAPGGMLNYTLTLTNTGTVEAQDVNLTDPLPSQLTSIKAGPTPTVTPTGSASVSCTKSGLSVSCTIDNFTPSSVVTITFSAMVNTTATGTITNTATAQSSTTPVSVTATAITTITSPPPPVPVHPNLVTSTNWSGYMVAGSTYQTVVATWKVPSISGCENGKDSGVSQWVGFDGYLETNLEQTGTDEVCTGGKALYYIWYEDYPEPQQKFSNNQPDLHPGDVVTATEATDGHGNFVSQISSLNWSVQVYSSVPEARTRTAEVIAEAIPQSDGSNPWPSFGSVTFYNCTIDHQSFAIGPTVYRMFLVGKTVPYPRDWVSGLSNGNTHFSVRQLFQ